MLLVDKLQISTGGGRGATEKTRPKSLPILYQYHVWWKSMGGRRPPVPTAVAHGCWSLVVNHQLFIFSSNCFCVSYDGWWFAKKNTKFYQYFTLYTIQAMYFAMAKNTIRVRSNIRWRFEEGEGLLISSDCVIWGRGLWPNRHITFIVAEKV